MQLAPKGQNGTIFSLFPRKLASKFLGVAAPNVTNDCKLLAIEKHPSGMTPEEVFTVWAYRVMFVHLHPTNTRTQVARKIKNQPKTSLKELNKAGYTFEMFCQQLQVFIESGCETPTPLKLNRPERENLKEYRAQQREREIKTKKLYLTRRETATLLNCSIGLVVKMVQALSIPERSLITERVFKQLVELRAKTVIWRNQFSKQPKTTLKLKRKQAKRARFIVPSAFLSRPEYSKIVESWKTNTRREREYLDKKLAEAGLSKL